MARWRRWQDWLALGAGIVLALTPLWFATGASRATWAMVALGVVLGVASLWSLVMPAMTLSEWVHAVVGVLALAAPWVFDYTAHRGAAWTSWIVGAAALVLGLWVLPATRQVLHRVPTHH